MSSKVNKRTQAQFHRVQGLFERTKQWRTNTDTLLNAFKTLQAAEDTYAKSLLKIAKSLKGCSYGHGIDPESTAKSKTPQIWTLEEAWSGFVQFMAKEAEARQEFAKMLAEKIVKPLTVHSQFVNDKMKYLTSSTQEMFDSIGGKKEELHETYKQRKKAVESAAVAEGPVVDDPWLHDIQYYFVLESLAQEEAKMSDGMQQLQKDAESAELSHINLNQECFSNFVYQLRAFQNSHDQASTSLTKVTSSIDTNRDWTLIRQHYSLADTEIWKFDHTHVPAAKDHRHSSVVHSGKLSRQGSLWTWREEHFELSPTGFFYSFEKPLEVKPLLSLNLALCDVRKGDQVARSFEIQTHKPSGSFSLLQSAPVYVLCAESDKVTQQFTNLVFLNFSP
eukprot:c13061_g1_i1.p1 GENE.c13061_g1_i1~~c13061_g1_i1.p1  ORF type:complete len:391 (-),score=93.81 c13061_g1_i1:483-1655(-)